MEKLQIELRNCKQALASAMAKIVMRHGAEFCENIGYYRNEFGIDEDKEEGVEVVKIVDIYNNGGCYFPHSKCYHISKPIEFVGDEMQWVSTAFRCLYVVNEFGFYSLKYYALENLGPEYDSCKSEPCHDYAETLSLQELEKLADWLLDYVAQKELDSI